MGKESTEVFFSIDVESDGPIPVRNSMLSFACAAFRPDGTLLDRFEKNLTLLPGAVPDPKTMEFWAKNPEAWAFCRERPEAPETALPEFVAWVKSFEGERVAVCMPSGFDFTYTYMYLMMFAGESPFSFSALDVKTYVSAILKKTYRNSGKRSWPARWFDKDLPHTHKAIDDATEQGLTFLKMRAETHGSSAAEVSDNFWRSFGGRPTK